MNDFIDSLAYWLADYYLTSTVLLVAVLVAIRCCRQPVKRLAVTKAAIVAMFALAGLCALPGWSVVSLGWPEAEQVASPPTEVTLPVDRSHAVVATNEVPRKPIALAAEAPVSFVAPPARENELTSWPSVIARSYFVGSAGVVLWLLVGAIAARRMVRRAQPAPGNLTEILRRIESDRPAAAELLVSGELDVAVALGVLRPRILLPQQWVSARSNHELSTVLAHEVAHIRNGDLAWLAASRVLLILQWAQPMYWLLRRSMRLDQEALADVAAAEQTGRQQYAEQLVAWARKISARPRRMLPAAVGLWESPSQLRRRLALLLDERLTMLRRCSLGWVITTSILIVALAALLSTATFAPLAVAEAGGGKSNGGAVSVAGVRTLPTGAKVEILAIGSNSETEQPERWWRPDGTPLVSTPFRVGGGSVSPSDDQSVRQFVMLVPGLPTNATVRWHVTNMVGGAYGGEVLLDGRESPPGYYSQVFCISKHQANFGLRVDVAVGDWNTVATTSPKGGGIGLSHQGVILSRAYTVSAPHLGEGTGIVITHDFVDSDVRAIAVDRIGKQHTASRTSITSTTSVLMQLDFSGLKVGQVDHFEFQTRDFESVEFVDLPAQPDTNFPAVEFQAAAEESAAESNEAELVGTSKSPTSSETNHVAVGPATFELASNAAPSTSSSEELTGDQAAEVAAAIRVLRETEGIGERPVVGLPVADDWAKSIRSLTDIGPPAVPSLIEALDEENRDHPISKLAFTLRAIGDPRAVPALIRAIPRTLVPSRSDFGLMIADPELLKFMQRSDLTPMSGGDDFDYGRSFREVVAALQKITGANQNDMELNWVNLGETESQRRIQRRLFHQLAEKWADWWTENWKGFGINESFATVDLPPLVESPSAGPATSLPSGEKLGLAEFHSEWIVEPARESGQRCFVDLDTSRQSDWPKELVAVSELSTASGEARQWARDQGFDLIGIRFQPKGFDAPLYCLQPIDLKAWEITPEEQRDLPRAMRGEIPYPLGRPVDLLVPRKQGYEGPDKNELGGTAFLFLTREGTAGLLRITAQVTDTSLRPGRPSTQDDQFSPVGFYRGAKISFAAMGEFEKPDETGGSDGFQMTVREIVPISAEGSRLPATVPTQDVVMGAGVSGTFVAGNPPTPWAYKPNVLAFDVQDDAGKPIEGVEAIVYRWSLGTGERAPVKQAATNERGEVEFTELVSPARSAELADKSRSPHSLQEVFYVVLRRPGSATVILPASDYSVASHGIRRGIRMRPAAELSGRVTDPSGKPVAGAIVAAGSLAGTFAMEGVNAVKTDADGRYRLTDLVAFDRKAAGTRENKLRQDAFAANRDVSKLYPAVYDPADDTGTSDLYVTHPDFAVTTVRGDDVPGTVDVVMQPAAAIEGRVVEFGTDKPAVDVQVAASGLVASNASPLQASAHVATTRTDANGRYRLANLPAGTYDVWAEEPSGDWSKFEWVSRGVTGIQAVVGDRPTKAPELVIGPGAIIHGQLIDGATGKAPMVGEGAYLRASFFLGEPQSQQNLPPQRVSVTPDGKFALRAIPGALRVFLMVNLDRDSSQLQGDYRSEDDVWRSGRLFDLKHGENVDAEFKVWSQENLEEKRAKENRTFELLHEQQYDEAIAGFIKLIEEDSTNTSALVGRALAEVGAGRDSAAIADYTKLLQIVPDNFGAMMGLADLLSTSPDKSVRDGRRAVELAGKALAAAPPGAYSNEQPEWRAIVVLAAAQAEAGDFSAAVATQREAIESAPERRKEEMRDRLKLFEAGKPYRREVPEPGR